LEVSGKTGIDETSGKFPTDIFGNFPTDKNTALPNTPPVAYLK